MKKITPDAETADAAATRNTPYGRSLHPVVARYHGPDAPFGIRCANAITGFMGS